MLKSVGSCCGLGSRSRHRVLKGICCVMHVQNVTNLVDEIFVSTDRFACGCNCLLGQPIYFQRVVLCYIRQQIPCVYTIPTTALTLLLGIYLSGGARSNWSPARQATTLLCFTIYPVYVSLVCPMMMMMIYNYPQTVIKYNTNQQNLSPVTATRGIESSGAVRTWDRWKLEGTETPS